MIQSMTGFASADYSDESLSMSLDIKGYNNRYLDMQFSLPGSLGSLEEPMRNLVKEGLSRGRVEVYLRVQTTSEEPAVRIERAQAEAIYQALEQLRKGLGIRRRTGMEDLLRFEGLVKLEKRVDPVDFEPRVMELFRSALDEFIASRKREGESTLTDMLSQMKRFEQGFAGIRENAGRIEAHINAQLRSRFSEVLGDAVDEQRVLTELAALLVKHSINEEISRLDAHIRQFHAELKGNGPVGKRLDFLCQEMNRETNTIGSKNLLSEIASLVVEMKDSLENIREQLRNIE